MLHMVEYKFSFLSFKKTCTSRKTDDVCWELFIGFCFHLFKSGNSAARHLPETVFTCVQNPAHNNFSVTTLNSCCIMAELDLSSALAPLPVQL